MKYLTIILLTFLAFSSCKKSSETESLTPTITGFTPVSSTIGSTVIISGENFSTTAIGNTVTFNGVAATVSIATSTELTVIVPSGATTGVITVTTASGTASTSSSFNIVT